MELHDHPFSPYAFKVRAALYEKGISFEKREVQKHADRERLLRLNPRGEVPAIVDGEAVICDSKVICAYLEERFPEPPLLPKDPVQRARARALELKSDGDLDACVFVLGLLKLTRPELAKQVPGALEKAVQALARHCAQLEREVEGREWFVGDFSLVDIALAPHLRAAAFMGYPPGAEHPALAAWLERVSARPSIRQAIRELAAGFAASKEPGNLFDPRRLHWRSDRIECALRVGLGPWLLEELAADRAFLSPLPS
jgi:glutathione S-transferase